MDAAIYQAQRNDSVITGINIIPKIPERFKNNPPYSPEGEKEAANIMKESKKTFFKKWCRISGKNYSWKYRKGHCKVCWGQ